MMLQTIKIYYKIVFAINVQKNQLSKDMCAKKTKTKRKV